MSDLFEVRGKTEEGTDWRGSITIQMDGEEKELTIRQLNDTENWDVMEKIDKNELQNLDADVDEELVSELQELEEREDLSDEEQERKQELYKRVEEEDMNLFDTISKETFEGIKQAAKYGVEPDNKDVRDALTEHAGEIEEQYGGTAHEDARQYVNDNVVKPMIEDSVDFTSFAIGIKVLNATLGDVKN
jgi:hypothetical protein